MSTPSVFQKNTALSTKKKQKHRLIAALRLNVNNPNSTSSNSTRRKIQVASKERNCVSKIENPNSVGNMAPVVEGMEWLSSYSCLDKKNDDDVSENIINMVEEEENDNQSSGWDQRVKEEVTAIQNELDDDIDAGRQLDNMSDANGSKASGINDHLNSGVSIPPGGGQKPPYDIFDTSNFVCISCTNIVMGWASRSTTLSSTVNTPSSVAINLLGGDDVNISTY
mmetsp:Transcript_7618/g.9513  ORF Transcript_7618/g.9513 Transcript_7618/m.9513 type:complete len:224 (+) Transcript_7618:334-1005(+)